jgi:lysyl-tRNA synthetase class 2
MQNTTILEEHAARLKRLEELKKRGINPYPSKPSKPATHTIAQSVVLYDKLKDKTITLQGRIRSLRLHGGSCFGDIADESGKIQIYFKKDEIGEKSYKNLRDLIDVGDFLSVTGSLSKTHKGEKTLVVHGWELLSKSLRPLPDKWYGFKNEDERFRKRYLDIMFNPEVREIVEKKAKFWNAVRQFFINKGFLEVETPVLENTTGGADAKPFITHHNALDLDVYLRISMGELWQKRLMVAGYEKTFEIGRQFRNEGMDAEHLQDYTQMEFYWAYADYEMGMELVEEMFKYVAQETFGKLKFKVHGFDVDLGKKWERYDYRETVKKFTGIDILDANLSKIESKLKELDVEYDKEGFNITRGIDNLWKYCRKQIGGPGFLINEPLSVSPLAKKQDDDSNIVQRFHSIIAGSELGNGYSELNDPEDQAERFKEQAKLREAGDQEAQMNDLEFVEALEYGMPPTCGFGMSERVFSFLMDRSARECQIFPLMRPKIQHKQEVQAGGRITENLGINCKEAKNLLDKYIKDPITKLHCRESEVIMRALAKHLKQDEGVWGIIGLLHDIDWEETKDDTKNHCVKAVEILKKAGASDFLVETIVSHAYGNDCGDYKDKKRSTQLQHALAAAETLTGLIIAGVLVRPDKKLKNLELKSLKKRFKEKGFAANCSREVIKECEKIGLSLDEFLGIGLEALQGISDELGF